MLACYLLACLLTFLTPPGIQVFSPRALVCANLDLHVAIDAWSTDVVGGCVLHNLAGKCSRGREAAASLQCQGDAWSEGSNNRNAL